MKYIKPFIALVLSTMFLVACASTPAEDTDAMRNRAKAGYNDMNSETRK